jgi:hypothetical protein
MIKFNQYVEKYRGQQTDISIGISPSGAIHVGNMATVALAVLLASRIGAQSEVNLTICDLEIPYKDDWSIEENEFVRYSNTIPDAKKCHSNLLGHVMDNLTHYISSLEELVSVPINTFLLSELQRTHEFREGLRIILEDKDLVRSIDPSLKQQSRKKVPLYLICNSCNTSAPYKATYQDLLLSGACENPECSVGKFSSNLYDLSTDVAMKLVLAITRDRSIKPYADIHVFGGDYNDGTRSKKSKMARIRAAVGAIGNGIPDIFIGPVYIGNDGEKMSKTNCNGITLDSLRDRIEDQYTQRMVELTTLCLQRNSKVIQYNIPEKIFR